MKKKIAMTVMALAVSAMAGSAFAAEKVPSKKIEGPAQMNMVSLIAAQPAINLEQMAKEKGITVEELIAELEKEGKLTKGVKLVKVKIDQKNDDGSVPTKDNMFYTFEKAINLEEVAKEKGITVEELIAQFEKEGKATGAVAIGKAQPLDQDGKTMTKIISLEDIAKEKGMSVEELKAQLEKEGTAAKTVPAVKIKLDAVPTTPAAKN
ncbi:hypothetical protein [Brevibacillus sp. NRS-1366]|uniref:hypothetical protein n=1 Tax=Brevibacillus sp. NRS-1366 TaxID=3233899 RepID=UPI003D1F3BC1